MDRVFSHIANNNPSPLVMVFAGPSGHGKTKLAEHMGVLLSVEHKEISCAEIDDRMDLLDASNSYACADEGSGLNNFVASNHGKRAVVISDEFDKTTKVVIDCLLTIIDRGMYTRSPKLISNNFSCNPLILDRYLQRPPLQSRN